MALTEQGTSQLLQIPGYDGKLVQVGQFSFSTTDANGELKINMHELHAIFFTPVGAVATDESLYLDEAVLNKDGKTVIPSTGTVTVARTGAAKTSGLEVMYVAFGV